VVRIQGGEQGRNRHTPAFAARSAGPGTPGTPGSAFASWRPVAGRRSVLRAEIGSCSREGQHGYEDCRFHVFCACLDCPRLNCPRRPQCSRDNDPSGGKCGRRRWRAWR
jgi:hypothetical protein